MARSTGTFTFPANFEVEKAAPLDARVATGLKADLTGLPFPYKGMIVSVTDDTEENNGTYVLNDTDGSVLDNWGKVSSKEATNLDYTDSTLTLTLSDGSTLTTEIVAAVGTPPTPEGVPGSSETPATVEGTQGTLSFNSRSV